MEDFEYRRIILGLLEKSNLTVEEIGKIELWLNAIIDNSIFLEALESSGVDNWEWYDEAVNEYRRLRDGE